MDKPADSILMSKLFRELAGLASLATRRERNALPSRPGPPPGTNQTRSASSVAEESTANYNPEQRDQRGSGDGQDGEPNALEWRKDRDGDMLRYTAL
jgi:hypothetical protein